jgi:hypothetical protein
LALRAETLLRFRTSSRIGTKYLDATLSGSLDVKDMVRRTKKARNGATSSKYVEKVVHSRLAGLLPGVE